MNLPDEEFVKKRRQVGLLAAVCLGAALTAFFMGELQNAWAAACLRIGLVLGALWTALPTRKRPAAWANISRSQLIFLIIAAILLPRLKFFLPVLLAGIGIGWLLRPKRSGRSSR